MPPAGDGPRTWRSSISGSRSRSRASASSASTRITSRLSWPARDGSRFVPVGARGGDRCLLAGQQSRQRECVVRVLRAFVGDQHAIERTWLALRLVRGRQADLDLHRPRVTVDHLDRSQPPEQRHHRPVGLEQECGESLHALAAPAIGEPVQQHAAEPFALPVVDDRRPRPRPRLGRRRDGCSAPRRPSHHCARSRSPPRGGDGRCRSAGGARRLTARSRRTGSAGSASAGTGARTGRATALDRPRRSAGSTLAADREARPS